MEIVWHGLNALLMMALPLILGGLLARRFRLSWGAFGAGAAAFVASQVLHIPFNAYVLNPFYARMGWQGPLVGWQLAAVAAGLGLSAGVFEQGANYATYRFWMKGVRLWEGGLMLGAGHGGIEALLLGALAAYGLLQAVALRGVDLATVVPADRLAAAQAQITAYWSTPWYASLLGAVERIFALCMHLSLSILVLQCFVRRNGLWLVAAIGWHALIDATAVFASQTVGPYLTEGLIGVGAILSLGILFALRTPPPASAEVIPPQVVPTLPTREDRPPSADRIDESRFSG